MATLEENIQQAISDFGAIKNAIESKGITVNNGTHTSQYANLIRSIDIRNIQNFDDIDEWLFYGGLDNSNYNFGNVSDIINNTTTYESLDGKTIYEHLLNSEASAAYAAYLKNAIASVIKNSPMALRQALTCNNKTMFFNSSFNFDENISNVIEKNPTVDGNKYNGIVSWSADRNSNPNSDIPDDGYYGWMAFNGGRDTSYTTQIFSDRGVWSAFGTNQWVQYKYNTAKYLYSVKIYSLRDNAPAGVIIEGSNDGENFTLIKQQALSGIIDVAHYDEIVCCDSTPFQYFRFTITDNVYSGSCGVGEIEIYTFKE